MVKLAAEFESVLNNGAVGNSFSTCKKSDAASVGFEMRASVTNDLKH
jgi:hypothetical protein